MLGSLGKKLCAILQNLATTIQRVKPRFVITGDEVYDTETDLTWQRFSVGQQWVKGHGCIGVKKQFTFDEAQQQGFGPWRVPSNDELVSLVNKIERPFIDLKAFPDMAEGNMDYWSCTLEENTLGGWGVSFHGFNGSVSNYFPDEQFAVRLVRRRYAFLRVLVRIALWVTGANSRYATNGGEVYDSKTGLTWQRFSVGQEWREGTGCTGVKKEFTFDEARQQGYGPWRVPNKDELSSLLDKWKPPRVDLQVFPDMRDEESDENDGDGMIYWSSTPINASNGRVVCFSNGRDRYGERSDKEFVRLVRGGIPTVPTNTSAQTKARFQINGDEVYDTKTDLTWLRYSVGQDWADGLGCIGVKKIFTFNEAQQQANGIWHVPSKSELSSIIEEYKDPTIDQDAFPDMTEGLGYWTSTEDNDEYAWYASLGFSRGNVRCKHRENLYAVRLVRSGR